MAGSKVTTQLWDEDPMDPTVNDTPAIKDKLKRNHVFLAKNLDLADGLWAEMYSQGVVTDFQKDSILAQDTRANRIMKLVECINKGPAYKFHRFLRCLYASEQQHIINGLGFKAEDYRIHKISNETEMPISDDFLRCPSCNDIYGAAFNLPCCGAHICGKCCEKEQKEMCCPVCQSELSEYNVPTLDKELSNFCLIYKANALSESSLDKCIDCHPRAPSGEVLHFCENCDGDVCNGCLVKHRMAYVEHRIHHLHQSILCCMHSQIARKICTKCRFHCCTDCVLEICKYHRTDSGPYGGMSKEAYELTAKIRERENHETSHYLSEKQEKLASLKEPAFLFSKEFEESSRGWLKNCHKNIDTMTKQLMHGKLEDDTVGFLLELKEGRIPHNMMVTYIMKDQN